MPFFNESAVPLTKKYENLLVVKTFSKGYSLAGMRCGYAVGNVSLIEGLFRCKDCFNSYPLDRVCRAVCAAAISDGAYYAEKNALVISERERLTEELRGRGFEVLPSKSNFVFARHTRLSGKEVYEGLRARGVVCARGGCWCAISKSRASKISAASPSAAANRTTPCSPRSMKCCKGAGLYGGGAAFARSNHRKSAA